LQSGKNCTKSPFKKKRWAAPAFSFCLKEAMYQSPIAQTLRPLIEPTLDAMGYEVVRILWNDSGRRTLQIMADRKDNEEITVEDCADISHTISAILDVQDPIQGAYDLEVSSPGMDRPLVKRADFDAYVGFEAKIEMQFPIEGRKRFKGRLQSSPTPETVELLTETGPVSLPYQQMQSAKLVLTDELIKASLRQRKKTKETN
jgi:ribosome maturation factor RimP